MYLVSKRYLPLVATYWKRCGKNLHIEFKISDCKYVFFDILFLSFSLKILCIYCIFITLKSGLYSIIPKGKIINNLLVLFIICVRIVLVSPRWNRFHCILEASSKFQLHHKYSLINIVLRKTTL